ncbi:MAG: glycosyltransferase family 39 protein [Rhodopirellula sp.]|nr:glycosyltransferase family 39 protein [Rhodopirellula sp.]
MKRDTLLSRWNETSTSIDSALSVRFQWIVVGAILLGTLSVRLSTIDSPSIDRSPWKEIDYLMISKSYFENGYRFLYPEIDWPAQEPRYTAMELPVVPYVAALCYGIFGYSAFSARLLPAVAWLVTALYAFLLGRRECGRLPGLVACLAAAVLPLHHPFGRLLFSEPVVIALSIAAVFHFFRWHAVGLRRDLLITLATFTLAIALKLTPLYLLLPLGWITLRSRLPQRDDGSVSLPPAFSALISTARCMVPLTLAALILPIAWYAWAWHLANESIDVFGIFGGRFGGHDKFQTVEMLSNADWYSTMIDRLTWQVCGSRITLALAALGVVVSVVTRRNGLAFAYLAAIGCFFAIVAEGQIDAPYRQLTILPALCLLIAVGAATLATCGVLAITSFVPGFRGIPSWLVECGTAAALCVVLTVPVSNRQIVFGQDRWTASTPRKWELAMRLRELAPPNSTLITLGEYTVHKGGNDLSPELYFYSGFRGFSLQARDCAAADIDALIRNGATHFVAVDFPREPEVVPFLNSLKSRFPVLHESERDLVLKLSETSVGPLLTSNE